MRVFKTGRTLNLSYNVNQFSNVRANEEIESAVNVLLEPNTYIVSINMHNLS